MVETLAHGERRVCCAVVWHIGQLNASLLQDGVSRARSQRTKEVTETKEEILQL
jgi:hypothetical protein